MRGKIVNLCIGFMNVLFGALLGIYTIYIPQNKTLLTVQENYVVNNILLAIYIILGCVIFLDVIQYYNHRKNTTFNTAYLFGVFSMSFVFIKEPAIAVFTLIAGIVIIYKSLKENLVEIDSTSAISVTIVLMSAIVIMSGVCFMYNNIAQNIKNRENKNELAYKTDFFKYVTELGEEYEDVYINVKRDGKYGYINQRGELVTDFIYDYASPFVKITMYNKIFYISLVCKEGSTSIILKNSRKVLSYITESADDNYSAKMSELEDVYRNILGQTGEMQFEAPKITDNIAKVPVYIEDTSDYTYRYDYNHEYDLIVTQSSLGLSDKYELAKKEDLNIRVNLDTSDLAYDENYLYLYSNGLIPFYEITRRTQGWFTSYGKKNEMTGKAQILEFVEDKILIKNYNDGTIYFINSSGQMLSETYKEIYIHGDRYIVKSADTGKYKVINKEFNKIFDAEFDVIDTSLVHKGLYICQQLDSEIEFNDYGFAKMRWQVLNYDGNVVIDNIEQIYGNYYEISADKSLSENKRNEEFLKSLKKIEYNFVGDNFYSSYKK